MQSVIHFAWRMCSHMHDQNHAAWHDQRYDGCTDKRMYFVMTTVRIRPVQTAEKSYYISKPLRDPLVINSFIIANEKDERIIQKKNCAGGNICGKRIL